MCPLKVGHVPHVHVPSKVTGAIVLQWCEVATVIQRTSSNLCGTCDIWSDPKSYNRYYVHFCVPWLLEVDSNDLLKELIMAASAASVDSLSM